MSPSEIIPLFNKSDKIFSALYIEQPFLQLVPFFRKSFALIKIMDFWDVGRTTEETDEQGYISYEIKDHTLNVVLSLQQQRQALSAQEQILNDLQKDFSSSEEKNNRIEYDSDYRVVSYYVDPNTNMNDMYSSWEFVVARCGWYRVLKGFGDDWMPTIRVYNSETKEQIAESDQDGHISWEESDWVE